MGAPRALPRIPITTHTLANGLTVAIVERPELPIVALDIVVMPGAERDGPAEAGRASMMAEMLDEGTPSRGPLAIAEEIDYLGADLSIRPGWDASSVSLQVMSSRLEAALDVVADCILNAAFPPAEYDRKQQERLSALLLEQSEPAVLAGKALMAGVFGDAHPFGAPVTGTRASIARLSCADVHRLFLEDFHAGNAFVIVVGDVRAPEIVAALDARIGTWRIAPATVPALPELPREQPRRVLLVDRPGAAQAELRVGHAAPARTTPDYFAIKVLNTILGGSFTARLNAILRERMGVTYGAHSRFRLRRNAGVFSAGAAIAMQAAARGARVVVTEMHKLRDEPVAADELKRAQNYIALGLPRSFETNADVGAHLRERLLYGLPADYWETYVDRVFAVTVDDVAQAAARHLRPEACVVAVVADAAQVRNALEKSGLGEVSLTDVEA